MALVNKEMMETFKLIVDRIMKCVADESEIDIIYIDNCGTTISNSVILENFKLTENGLYIESYSYWLDVKKQLKNAEYIDMDTSMYTEVHLEFEDGSKINIDIEK